MAFSFQDENHGIRKDMDMGNLFDSLSEKGFLERRRRSGRPRKNEVSNSRQFARFLRFPLLEDEDSD